MSVSRYDQVLHQLLESFGVDKKSLVGNGCFSLDFDDGDSISFELSDSGSLSCTLSYEVHFSESSAVIEKILDYNHFKNYKPDYPFAYFSNSQLILKVKLKNNPLYVEDLLRVLMTMRSSRQRLTGVD